MLKLKRRMLNKNLEGQRKIDETQRRIRYCEEQKQKIIDFNNYLKQQLALGLINITEYKTNLTEKDSQKNLFIYF